MSRYGDVPCCSQCGRPYGSCSCKPYWDRKNQSKEIETPETIDWSFQCYTIQTHFDYDPSKDEKMVELSDKENENPNRIGYKEIWVPFLGNENELLNKAKKDIQFLGKYKNWLFNQNVDGFKKEEELKHEALEDYCVSRLTNIHNILMPFYINNQIKDDLYKNYIDSDKELQENFENFINVNNEKDKRLKLLKNYIVNTKECLVGLYQLYE